MRTSTTFLPIHRLLIQGLALLSLGLISWASWAELDIIVTAQGKLVPLSFVRITQPPEDGVIRGILVKDGQEVQEGQLLVELDPVFAQEDVRAAEAHRARLHAQLERIDAELSGKPFLPSTSNSSLGTEVLTEYTLRKQAFSAALAEATAAESRARYEQRAAKERLTQAEKTLPFVERLASQQAALRQVGFVSEAAVLDKEKDLVIAKQEKAAQQQAAQAAEAALSQARSTSLRVLADYRRQLAAERSQAQADLATLDADQAKKSHRLNQLALRAPTAGVINGLASLAPGQVVRAGQTLMTLVPQNEKLQFEGWVRNEDAANIIPSMAAKVKLAGYPFQRYGWAHGTVTWLGVDAETPDTMKNVQGTPLFYRVRVELGQQALERNGQRYAFKAGMQATGDIQIGTRTLIEYLTSPLRKVLNEAAREK